MKGKQLYLFGLKQNNEKTPEKQRLKLPLDVLTIAGVVFALSLIISFSLGVEKGKNISSGTRLLKQEKLLQNLDVASEKQLAQPDGKEEESSLEGNSDRTEIVKNQQKYKIQVASFHKENTARKEAEQLQEKGYPTLITKKGKYVVIYVGEFDDEGEAKSNFELLQEKYKDCILRRL